MQDWLNFFIFFFWLSLIGFIFNPSSFLSLIFFSEISWLLLYLISILCGSINDDLNLISLSFLVISLAGLEFSFSFLLLTLFKNFNNSIYFLNNDKRNNYFNSKNINHFSNNYFFWL